MGNKYSLRRHRQKIAHHIRVGIIPPLPQDLMEVSFDLQSLPSVTEDMEIEEKIEQSFRDSITSSQTEPLPSSQKNSFDENTQDQLSIGFGYAELKENESFEATIDEPTNLPLPDPSPEDVFELCDGDEEQIEEPEGIDLSEGVIDVEIVWEKWQGGEWPLIPQVAPPEELRPAILSVSLIICYLKLNLQNTSVKIQAHPLLLESWQLMNKCPNAWTLTMLLLQEPNLREKTSFQLLEAAWRYFSQENLRLLAEQQHVDTLPCFFPNCNHLLSDLYRIISDSYALLLRTRGNDALISLLSTRGQCKQYYRNEENFFRYAQHAFDTWGHTIWSENGEMIGIVSIKTDANGRPIMGFQAINCKAPAKGSHVCQECQRVKNIIKCHLNYVNKHPNYKPRKTTPKIYNRSLLQTATPSSLTKENLSSLSEILAKIDLPSLDDPSISINPVIDLPFDDNKFLLSWFSKVLTENSRTLSNCFVFRLLSQQLRCLSTKDPRGMRWDPKIIHWAMSIQYYGGKACLNTIRGIACSRGKGDKSSAMTVDPSKWGLFLPSTSTLKAKISPKDPYEGVTDNHLDTLTEIQKRNNYLLEGGISADEIEIREGLQIQRSFQQIVGLAKHPIPIELLTEEEVARLTKDLEENSEQKLAKYVFQLFFTSTDGRVTFPLGFFPTSKIDADQMSTIYTDLITRFKKRGILITWGSTDGATQPAWIDDIRKTHPSYEHIFDYVHLVKILRNLLLEKTLQRGSVAFSISSLEFIRLHDPAIAAAISSMELHPSDKMELKPVTKLLDLIPLLKVSKVPQAQVPEVQEVIRYLEAMEKIYNTWNSNSKEPISGLICKTYLF